jgi:hypothetical protein
MLIGLSRKRQGLGDGFDILKNVVTLVGNQAERGH